MLLISCGGGSNTALPEVPATCSTNEFQTLNNDCIKAQEVFLDSDNVADGLDLNNDTVPELLYTGITNGITGISIDGDDIPEYFIKQNEKGQYYLYKDKNATQPATFVFKNNKILGIDTTGDGQANDTLLADIYNDSVEPTSSASIPSGKVFKSSQIVLISCTDNIICNAIAYTLDGSDPSFDKTKNSATKIISSSAPQVNIGDQGDATYTLKFIARDAAGNIESNIHTNIYTISATACTTSLIANTGVDSFINMNRTGTAKVELLNGSASTPQNIPLSYTWVQLVTGDAPNVTGNMQRTLTGQKPAFEIPDHVTTLKFQLTVSDNNNCASENQNNIVSILVLDDITKAVFVDGNAGNDTTGNGTKTQPFATITHAITTKPGDDIYIAALDANASYDESTATLILPDGTSLYGGFDQQWVRFEKTKSKRTRILGNSTAIDISNMTSNIWISGLHVVSSDTVNSSTNAFSIAVNLGTASSIKKVTVSNNTLISGSVATGAVVDPGSSYGIYAKDEAFLVIDNNDITAGNAASGVDGVNGVNGVDAVFSVAMNSDPVINGINPACNILTLNTLTGSIGGSNPINSALNGARGGDGGSVSTNFIGTNGQGTCGGLAGYSTIGQITERGQNGCDGIKGINGADSITPGKGVDIYPLSSLFSPQTGGSENLSGKDGMPGSGGGMGYLDCQVNQANNRCEQEDKISGDAGAGGGAAGSAGQKATSGGGAGASITIYSHNNANVVVSNNTFFTGLGGNGGKAGIGGLGGTGSSGGLGTLSLNGVENVCSVRLLVAGRGGPFDKLLPVYTGGDGGKGGNGGRGGHGSPGGGGPSIGIYFTSGQTTTNITGNVFVLGKSGTAGKEISTMLPAENGYQCNIFDFDTSTKTNGHCGTVTNN